ncbi:MAG: chemotaxis protein CheX [bacterium]
MTGYQESLAATVTRTLEDMCFFYVSPVLTDEQRDAHLDGAMEVTFCGPRAGRLVVSLSGDTLPTLASNMLGDADGSPDMQRDALGEVANVICGNLLPIIGGTGAVYSIGAATPAIMPRNREDACLRAQVHLGVEEMGRADVLLYIDRDME